MVDRVAIGVLTIDEEHDEPNARVVRDERGGQYPGLRPIVPGDDGRRDHAPTLTPAERTQHDLRRGRTVLTDTEREEFARDGVLHLGRVLDAAQLDALTARADALADGRVVNPAIRFQLDTGGDYDELGGIVERLDGDADRYRKIQGLERDDVFGPLVCHPRFVAVCASIYGPHVPISVFRAMVMNKPAHQGTVLPWHQDGGAVWELDRDPLVTVWVALDAATPGNGCLEIVRGSHRLGLLSWYGSTVADDEVARHCAPEAVEALPVDAGCAVLLHNWLLHRSGVNPTATPRRAFTCCYLDARTRNNLTGDLFPLVWGTLPETTPAYLTHLRAHAAALEVARTEAEQYALSLRDHNEQLQASLAEATTYARALEQELAKGTAEGTAEESSA